MPPLRVIMQQYDDIDLGTCRMSDKRIVERKQKDSQGFRGDVVRAMEDTQEDALRERLEQLRQHHRDLDAAIQSLESSGTGDQLQLRRLKKMKLTLKDEIQLVENRLIPDIIA